MAEKFGGPVWHASGRGRTRAESKRIVFDALRGVGDRDAGEWYDEEGMGAGVVHLIRRLSQDERDAFGVPEPFDIRGTPEQARRVAAVLDEAPYLRGRFG